MRMASRCVWLLSCALALCACGSDTSPQRQREHPRDTRSPSERDAGADPQPRDGGPDASASLRDATVGSGDAAIVGDASAVPRCGMGDDCDLLDTGSCGIGEGCAFALATASAEQPEPRCMPVGSGRDGTACDAREDCAAGLDCTARDGGGECRGYCCAWQSTLGCPAGQFCGIALSDARGELTDVSLCDACDDCDVRDPQSCGADHGCYVLPGLGSCRACLPAGERVPGEICSLSTDCQRGSACVRDGSGEQRCIEFCDLTTGAGCGADTTCRPSTGSALPASTGLCL
jgi:hypothetical protein